MWDYWFFFFFFQAEDGIRDLVRSRGLGDVYKRQRHGELALREIEGEGELAGGGELGGERAADAECGPVSYTHLTLPTSDLV